MLETLDSLLRRTPINQYERLFKSLFRKAYDSRDTVPVIRLISEPERSIEIPANIQELLKAADNSKDIAICEVVCTPHTIFMITKTNDPNSPRILGAVFNLKERRFFTRDLVAIKDGESVAPLLEPSTRSNYIPLTKDNILELTSFIKDVSRRQNVKYSLHRENPMELYSPRRRYFVTTKGAMETSSQDAGRIASA